MSDSTEMTTKNISIEMMRESLHVAVVCDALDSFGFRNQSPRVQLKPYTLNQLLVGRAKTTLWASMAHEDPHPYDLELKSVDSCHEDDIFIAAADGCMLSGIWGELLSTAACNRGCVGAIIDGAIRDVKQMTEMEFPVFAKGTSPYDSLNRQRVIDIDVPVEIDGVKFVPGDLIFADMDGVIVVPQEIEEKVIQAAWKKVHAENITRDSIKEGMLATDAYAKYGIL